MNEPESKSRNRLLDAGIVVLGLVMLVLVWSLVNRVGAPRPDPTRVYNPSGLLGDIIQVEVRNGCGVSGLAARMTDYLRSYGFDVVEHGDYASFDVEKTRIIDRIGNRDAAKQIALALGIPDAEIEEDVRADYFLDASVIIGMDYRTVMPFIDEQDEAEADHGE
jgi:hypothetical protein